MWMLDELKKQEKSDKVAVMRRETSLTYRQLWQQSEAIANYILKTAKTDAPVVIYGNKDIEIVPAMVGILKSGRAYVPVDITFPLDRLEKIAKSTKAEFLFDFASLSAPTAHRQVIDRQDLQRIVEEVDIPEIEERNWVKNNDICYILFTSGSTGEPKGVQITKKNILNFVEWFLPYAKVRPNGAALNQVSYSFDVSVIQLYIYLPLQTTLFSVDKEMIGYFGALFAHLATSNLTSWVSTPSFIEMCAVYDNFNRDLLPRLEKIILAGEVLTKKLVRTLWKKFPGVEIINGYGPTEGTVLLTCCRITEEMVEDDEHNLPIGSLVNDATFWIEREDKTTTTEQNKKGELLVSSQNISKGYYNNPSATEKRFFMTDDGWAYRTGDLVYRRKKRFYYCGRVDFQIKLNGYRIELDDISRNLNRLACIGNNVVLPVEREGRVAYLVAFITLSSPVDLSPAKISIRVRKELAQYVPSYMIPKKIVVVEQFPLNTNGKIDRKKLMENYL